MSAKYLRNMIVFKFSMAMTKRNRRLEVPTIDVSVARWPLEEIPVGLRGIKHAEKYGETGEN